MAFNQTYNAPIGQVINNENGTVILNESSAVSDVVRLLEQNRQLIQSNQALDEPTRSQAVERINSAIGEAGKPKPDKAKVSEYVSDTAKIVEGAGKTASGLVSLADTLFKIGKWVAVFM